MNRYVIVPIVASLLLAGVAVAQTASSPPAANSAGPDGDWHGHHHHMGFRHHMDPLANLPKPLTADAVKRALSDWFARRPQVKDVVDKDPNVLVVEIVDPDGKTHRFELNKTTGARRPSW